MGITAFPQALPAPKQPLVNQDSSITNDYRQFLLALFNTGGGASGVPSVDAGPNNTGAVITAGTAYTLTSDWTWFVTVPSGGQAQLPAMVVGTDAIIFNDDSADAVGILPQSGVQIDALGAGSPYSLAHGKMQVFRCVAPTQLKSMQLG